MGPSCCSPEQVLLGGIAWIRRPYDRQCRGKAGILGFHPAVPVTVGPGICALLSGSTCCDLQYWRCKLQHQREHAALQPVHSSERTGSSLAAVSSAAAAGSQAAAPPTRSHLLRATTWGRLQYSGLYSHSSCLTTL